MKTGNIKFKAKRLDNGEWVCGYFYEENGNTYIIENRQEESMLNRNITYEVDPSTVCMFTGLKDCNGKEIWEGDIVRPPLIIRGTFKIEWDDFSCGFRAVDDTEYIHSPISSLFRCHKWVVVGNKFDKEK